MEATSFLSPMQMCEIQATHNPTDDCNVDVGPTLEIITHALQRTASSIINEVLVIDNSMGNIDTPQPSPMENDSDFICIFPLENGTIQHDFDADGKMNEAMALIIQQVYCEITCKCLLGEDVHVTTMKLLKLLSNYRWEAKVAITLGAVAIAYGEFGLAVDLWSKTPLGKSVAMLKKLPDLRNQSNALTMKHRLEILNRLIATTVNVTQKIMAFKKLQTEYSSYSKHEHFAVAVTTHIPKAAYSTIKSVVSCATHIANLTVTGHGYTTSSMDTWGLSNLIGQQISCHKQLKIHYDLCEEHIKIEKREEAYKTLRDVMKPSQQIDNIRILKHLLCMEDHTQASLFQCSTKSEVHVKELKQKTVLLLISDLDVKSSYEEFTAVEKVYKEKQQEYEIVWVPVIEESRSGSLELTKEQEEIFTQRKSEMSWYTVCHPKNLQPAVIRYTKEVWKFSKKTILVALDSKGNLACQNALHMYLIWGNKAFPFSDANEKALWQKETWGLQFLLEKTEPRINQWVKEEKHICVVGGADSTWMTNFTKEVSKLAVKEKIVVETIYTGKNNAKEKTAEIKKIIDDGNITANTTDTWHFWSRLECMLYSKMRHESLVEIDVQIMKEVKTVLSFDGGDHPWVMWFKSETEMTRAHGKEMLDCLQNYDQWKDNIPQNGFFPSLKDHVEQKTEGKTPCDMLVLPANEGEFSPTSMVCSCTKRMVKYYMYRCETL